MKIKEAVLIGILTLSPLYNSAKNLIVSPNDGVKSYSIVNLINPETQDTTKIYTNHMGMAEIPDNLKQSQTYYAFIEPSNKEGADKFKPYETDLFKINPNNSTIIEGKLEKLTKNNK